MIRTRAVLAPLIALSLVFAPPVRAQAPTPELMAAFSGTWKLDRERSEPLPPVARSLVGAGQQPPRSITTTETTTVVVEGTAGNIPVAPTGGGGRRGGGAGATGAPPAASAGAARAPRGGPTARYIAEMATELAPPPTLIITASDSAIVLANTAGAEIVWPADGKVHQHAQMDGTMLEESGEWKGDKIELHNAVHGSLDLKRELKLVDKGTVLEIKIELGGASMPRKVTRKVYYTR